MALPRSVAGGGGGDEGSDTAVASAPSGDEGDGEVCTSDEEDAQPLDLMESGYETIRDAFEGLLSHDPPVVFGSGNEESAEFVYGLAVHLARCEDLAERYFRMCQMHGFPRVPPWDGPRFAKLWSDCGMMLIARICGLYRLMFKERYMYDAETGTVETGRLVELAYLLYLRCHQNSRHCAGIRSPRPGEDLGASVPTDIPYVKENGLARTNRQFSRMRASDLMESVLQLDYSWMHLRYDRQLVLYMELLELRLADVLFEPHTELVHDRPTLREPHPGHMIKRMPVRLASVIETRVGAAYLRPSASRENASRGLASRFGPDGRSLRPETCADIDEEEDEEDREGGGERPGLTPGCGSPGGDGEIADEDEDDYDYDHDDAGADPVRRGETRPGTGGRGGEMGWLSERASTVAGLSGAPRRWAVETREVRLPLYHQSPQFTARMIRCLMHCHIALHGYHRIPTSTLEERRRAIPWAYTSARREAADRLDKVLRDMTTSATVEDMESSFANNYLNLSCRPSEVEEHLLRATDTARLSFRPVRRNVDAMTILVAYRYRADANRVIEGSKRTLKEAIDVPETQHAFCSPLARIALMDRLMFGRSGVRFHTYVYFRMHVFNALDPRYDNLAQICDSEAPSLLQSFNYFYLCHDYPRNSEEIEEDRVAEARPTGRRASGKLLYELESFTDGLALWCHLMVRDRGGMAEGMDLSDSFRKLFGDDWYLLLTHPSDVDPDTQRPIIWGPRGLCWVRETSFGPVPGDLYDGSGSAAARSRTRHRGRRTEEERERRRYLRQVSDLVVGSDGSGDVRPIVSRKRHVRISGPSSKFSI